MSHGFNPDCPTRQLLDRLGDKWTVLTVSALGTGPRRFGELRRELGGISQKVLTKLVRSLERDGFVSRHVLAKMPLQVEYRLTGLGVRLAQLLSEIRAWSSAYMRHVAAMRTAYDASESHSTSVEVEAQTASSFDNELHDSKLSTPPRTLRGGAR